MQQNYQMAKNGKLQLGDEDNASLGTWEWMQNREAPRITELVGSKRGGRQAKRGKVNHYHQVLGCFWE